MSRQPIPTEGHMFLKRLGLAIREVRRERRWHQEQLAARAGVSGPRIGEIERGIVNTSVARIAAIADALEIPPSQLFRRMEIAVQDAGATELQRSRVAEAMRRLDGNDLKVLTKLVALFLKGR